VGELSDLAKIYPYSESSGMQRRIADNYLVDILAHPDEGSEFDKKIGPFKKIFRIPVVQDLLVSVATKYLLTKGYDLLMLSHEDTVIGHYAFQIHDDSLHVFSIRIDPKYRGNGLTKRFGPEIINYARNRGIRRIRDGAGGNEFIKRDYALICLNASSLGVKPLDNYWLELESTV
jgi:GNAT superfamily N-acetyltransferase